MAPSQPQPSSGPRLRLLALAAAVLLAAGLAPPASATTGVVRAIDAAAGDSQACFLLENGNVRCVGNGPYGEAQDYLAGDAVGLAAWGTHTCVLTSTGTVDCYGSNRSGEGDDYTTGDAVQVAAGYEHNCVLTSAADVACWGNSYDDRSAPRSSGDALQVATGHDHTCILVQGGDVDCQGNDDFGQAADYTGGDAVAVAAGAYHTCVLRTDHNVTCWGMDWNGQNANYTGGDAIAVTAGYYNTCIVTAAHGAKCWGALWNDEAEDYDGGDVAAIGSGMTHTCLVKTDGNVDCGPYQGYDYVPPRVLLHLERVPVAPSVPLPPAGTPPVELPLGTFSVHDEGSNLCVSFTPEGGAAIPVDCTNRAFLGPLDALVPRGDTPLLTVLPQDAGALGATPSVEVTVDVAYHHDPTHVTFVTGVLGTVEAWTPVAPDPQEADWLAANAKDLSLDVTVTPYVGGEAQPPVGVRIPLVGQVLAAAEASVPA